MARTRTSPVRAVLRFVASVMIVSGVLMIADAGVTLAWQEPISSVLSDREQSQLSDKLDDPPRRVLERQPLKGDAIARLQMPAIDKSAFVVEGTDLGTLRKGPGHYPETALPGEKKTVAIAGHRTTYGAPFRNIDDLKKGHLIRLELPDGTFLYKVERTQIVDDKALWVKRNVGYDRLVLTACHPLHSAKQRVVTFARLTRRLKPAVKG